MAPTPLTVQTVVPNGIALVPAVAADVVNGNVFPSNGQTTTLYMRNTVAAAAQVTVTTPFQAGGNAIADKVYTLPATVGAELEAGPFDPAIYDVNVAFMASAATVFVKAKQV